MYNQKMTYAKVMYTIHHVYDTSLLQSDVYDTSLLHTSFFLDDFHFLLLPHCCVSFETRINICISPPSPSSTSTTLLD